MVYRALAAIIIGYVLGSIPTAYNVGRLRKGIDIRKVGSHNMGTMNVLREVGIAEAFLVLAVDAGKGIAAILIARAMNLPEVVVLIAGAAAIAGHIFPVFLGFRGGIGGATGMGILLLLMPWSVPIYFVVTAVGFAFTRNLTFAYGVAFVIFPFVGWFVYHSVAFLVFSLAVILALLAHNIPTASEIMREGFRKTVMRSSFRQSGRSPPQPDNKT